MTTVFLVDDQTLFRVGLKQVLEELEGVEVVGEASDLTSAIPQLEHELPEVALLAIGPVDDTSSIQEAQRRFPTVSLVVISESPSDEEAVAVMEAGAVGYLPRTAGPEMVTETVRAVANGRYPIASWLLRPGVASGVLQAFREMERLEGPLGQYVAPFVSREESILTSIAANTGSTEGESVSEEMFRGSLISIVRKVAASGHLKAETLRWRFSYLGCDMRRPAQKVDLAAGMFAGLRLMEPERYITTLYREFPEALEKDLADVPSERTFHTLVGSGLFQQDRRIFENLYPQERHVIAIADIPHIVTAVDKLLSLGYATRILLLPSLWLSPRLPVERKNALTLWVCRQPSLRDGFQRVVVTDKCAIAVAHVGPSTEGFTQGLIPPARLSVAGISQIGLVLLAPFPRDALQEYIATCGAAGVRVNLSEIGQTAEAEL